MIAVVVRKRLVFDVHVRTSVFEVQIRLTRILVCVRVRVMDRTEYTALSIADCMGIARQMLQVPMIDSVTCVRESSHRTSNNFRRVN